MEAMNPNIICPNCRTPVRETIVASNINSVVEALMLEISPEGYQARLSSSDRPTAATMERAEAAAQEQEDFFYDDIEEDDIEEDEDDDDEEPAAEPDDEYFEDGVDNDDETLVVDDVADDDEEEEDDDAPVPPYRGPPLPPFRVAQNPDGTWYIV
jgi:hypothetical protein